jgi:hypothetical protein
MKFAVTWMMLGLAAGAPARSREPTEILFDQEPWRLALFLGDLKPVQGYPDSPNRQVLTYGNEKGVMLSVIVQKIGAPATLASCLNVFDHRKQGRDGTVPVNEVHGQRSQTAYQEYDLILGAGANAIVHHDIFSCRVRGNYYIDVHASKLDYRRSDHAALMALVDGVRIVE